MEGASTVEGADIRFACDRGPREGLPGKTACEARQGSEADSGCRQGGGGGRDHALCSELQSLSM